MVPRNFHLTDLQLALLPSDILYRIAEYLEPTISPFQHYCASTGPSDSRRWTQLPRDLRHFGSTCRGVYNATRPLLKRYCNLSIRRIDFESNREEAFLKKLASIVSANDDGSLRLCQDSRNSNAATLVEHAKRVDSEIERNEGDLRIDATKVRHLAIHFEETALQRSQGLALADKIGLLSRLETVAFVWENEDVVVGMSPYSLIYLPTKIVEALSSSTTLRELYLCGITLRLPYSHAPYDLSSSFGPQFESLTMNACDDSVLELLRFMPSATVVQLWRDYAGEPQIDTEPWWTKEMWNHVEHLDMTGFAGTAGTDYFRVWIDSLLNLRDPFSNVAPSIPLRVLRLAEPYRIETLLDKILPAIAHLPHLRHLTVQIWNDRRWKPSVLKEIWTNVPMLEELGIAIENEDLQWWQGDLREWGTILSLFTNLQTFTWNYTPFSELNYEDLRTHVYKPLVRGICQRHSNLEIVRWFGNQSGDEEHRFLELKKWKGIDGEREKAEWKWMDDEVFRRELPNWIEDFDDDEGGEQEEEETIPKRKKKKRPASVASSPRNTDNTGERLTTPNPSEVCVVDEDELERRRERKAADQAKPRNLMGLFQRVAPKVDTPGVIKDRTMSATSGVDEEKENAGDDSGFFEFGHF